MELQESKSRGDMLLAAIYQRARDVVPGAEDPYSALEQDGGIRRLLESAFGFSPNVTYAAIVNKDGKAIAHNSRTEEGQKIPAQEDLSDILDRNSFSVLRAVFLSERTYEMRQPLLFGDQDQQFGSIRIGISTLLVKSDLREAFGLALWHIAIALVVSTIVSMLL